MFKDVKGFKKEDLKFVAEEIGENVPTDAKVTDLKDIILSSDEYKKDPDFVKVLLQNTVSERKIKEEKEKEREDKKFEQEQKYKFELEKAKLENEVTLARIRQEQEPSQFNPQIHAPDNVEARRKFTLPKLELRKFNGDVKEWLPFWSQFEKIDQDTTIEDSDKFQYLLQATVEGSRAKEAIESFPPTAENYSKAIDCLQARFGRKDLLIEVYVRELLKLVLKNATQTTPTNLSALYDSLETQIRALETLGVTKDKSAALLHPLVESCMPEDFLRAWQRSPNVDHGGDPKDRLDSLLKFLKSEVESEERIVLAMTGFGLKEEAFYKKRAPNNYQYKLSSAASLLSTTGSEENLCIFCNKKHESFNCFKAQKMSIADKRIILKDKNRCFKCFKANHRADRCRCFIKCPVCAKAHRVIMCPETAQNRAKEEKPTPNNIEKKDQEDQIAINLASFCNNPKVLLQTLKVKIIGKTSTMCVRALFDSGSQKSYVKKEIAEALGILPLRQQRVSHSVFGGSKLADKLHNIYKIELGALDGNFLCNFDVLDQDNICDDVPSVTKGPWTKELNSLNIFLNDCEEKSSGIDILIGADVSGRLFTGKRKVLSGGLVATETYLGWTLMGKTAFSDNKEDTAMTVISMFVRNANISDLFSLDVLGITDPIETKSRKERDYRTKQYFEDTVKRNEEGRYEIALPWKDDHLPLPSNKNLALKRLEISTNKLIQSENLFLDYDQVFKEWESLGIIEELPQEAVHHEHYLPHRPVVKQQGTTKVRPVFDASAKQIGSPSLNQCLESGPNLLELIPSLLLKFRERKYGIIADIEKAFLQISVRPEERNFLLFFWWKEEKNENLKILRHTRVVFGVKSSPFLLAAVLEYHLKKYLRLDKFDVEIVNRLLHSFYVDNLVTSLDDKCEISPFIEESRHIMSEGKFNLRGWQFTEDEDPEKVSLVLGLKWNREKDILSINLDWLENYSLATITKRLILSISHKVFDPIGFLCPVLLIPKLLLQKMWKDDTSWDSKVEADIRKEFLDWFGELNLLKQVTIKRWFSEDPKCIDGISVHTFCDASAYAYAAAVFVRVEHSEGVTVHLLAAKSRVAPVKPISIPRLELLAATVGARLCTSVIEGLQWKDVERHFWTDSTTVLTWIQQNDSWKVFVSNRVQEIRKLTDPATWNHIPGTHNIADLPSRGCSARQLLTLRWWEGPKWLTEIEANWPATEQNIDEVAISQERKKIKIELETESVICALNPAGECEYCDSTTIGKKTSECRHLGSKWYYYYFSNYDKIVRMVAWIQRFINNCRQNASSRITGELSYREVEVAEKKIVKIIQDEYFVEDNKNKLKNLSTYTDDEGIIRLRTKLTYRKDSLDFRSPMILPSDHQMTKRLIMTEHLKNSHAKSQMLTNILREHYWILNARKTVRSVVSKCIVCLRHAKQNLTAPIPPLPENRIKDTAIFQIVGFDMAGPLLLKDGTKAWICIYTCAVYRAVHLELVSSLSTEAFLQSFRRFISRRGRPSVVYCDNGTNFVGASNQLKLVDWDEIARYSTTKKIQWLFNPPTAAWYGGFWERLVGVMKQILRRVLGKALLSYEEMTTILCDTEFLINSRPLTHVAENDSELVALSPNSFLQDFRRSGVPDLDQIDEKLLNKRLRYRQKLMTDIRKRFRSEYLGLLIQKNDHRQHNRKVQLGDIVLIGSDNIKCNDWPLGLVIEMLPGKDDITRVVRLKTTNGQIIRPIQRLYPLEVSAKSADSPANRPSAEV